MPAEPLTCFNAAARLVFRGTIHEQLTGEAPATPADS